MTKWTVLFPQSFVDRRTRLTREHGLVNQSVRAYRGVISRIGEGGAQEIERCGHAHSKPRVARECAERWAKRRNGEDS